MAPSAVRGWECKGTWCGLYPATLYPVCVTPVSTVAGDRRLLSETCRAPRTSQQAVGSPCSILQLEKHRSTWCLRFPTFHRKAETPSTHPDEAEQPHRAPPGEGRGCGPCFSARLQGLAELGASLDPFPESANSPSLLPSQPLLPGTLCLLRLPLAAYPADPRPR